jgi:hypothetical protein
MLLQGVPIGGTAFNLGGLNARRLREPVSWFADQYLQFSANLRLRSIVLWDIRRNPLHCTSLAARVDRDHL